MPLEEALEELLRGPWGYALSGILGALFGSFANVCIYRMPPSEEHPRGRSIVSPGSQCGSCGQAVRWFDNIPILSFLWLRGRCRHCGAEFSPRYLLVEAATAMLFVAAFHLVFHLIGLEDPLGLRLIRFGTFAGFLLVLVVITFIDLDHQLILDKITYPSVPIFYGLGLLLPERHWSDGLIGAAVGYGLVRLISDGYYFITRREGMGYGDGKLLAIIGALFGWQAVIVALFVGSLLGSVISIAVIAIVRRSGGEVGGGRGGGEDEADEDADAPQLGADADSDQESAALGQETPLRHVTVPFGPFLAAGAVVFLFAESWLHVRMGVLWGMV